MSSTLVMTDKTTFAQICNCYRKNGLTSLPDNIDVSTLVGLINASFTGYTKQCNITHELYLKFLSTDVFILAFKKYDKLRTYLMELYETHGLLQHFTQAKSLVDESEKCNYNFHNSNDVHSLFKIFLMVKNVLV